MVYIIILLIIFLVVLLLVGGLGIGIGFLLQWILPIELGMGLIAGAIIAGWTINFATRLINFLESSREIIEDSEETVRVYPYPWNIPPDIPPPPRSKRKRK